ncbi:angiotensin-converting enzyme-like [Belonocnema kinseyi]|uniref:angiotensin-converting enzyme-like n=1 Tax=Belonocnema kinseyi TaxID=2817044 RepID=UPI00143D667A|nr:angiotensin-converting enzyme-like [Belonocnema kinseyi]
MMLRALLAIAILATAGFTQEHKNSKAATNNNPNELLKKAKEFLATANKEDGEWINKQFQADWNYDTNITDANSAVKLEVSNEASGFNKILWEKVKSFPWRELKDENVKRQFYLYSNIDEYSLPEKEFKEYADIRNQMTENYSTAKLCDPKNPKNCTLSLQPEIETLMAQSRDPELLLDIWKQWRNVIGQKIKPLYPRYVELGNMAAKLNNFTDKSEMWLQRYEAKDFEQDIGNLWRELKPFFLQIHAYVRSKLNQKYGDSVVSKDGPIPAHLLGEMWGATWTNIADFTLPYPGKMLPDVTAALVAQKYDAIKMFRLAESAFVSMNMSAMPELFWKNSLMVKPTDREVDCHENAWDFRDGKDFRIKMCTQINSDYLDIVHHEMSHIQNYLQYKDQPIVFRNAANPGFGEGAADVIGLSTSTPDHLQKIKLLGNYTTDQEASLNQLYLMSLEKLVFLPFGYIVDLWRYEVFRGRTTKDQYNCKWWKLVEEYQGLEPPVDRSEDDLDPVAKYHVAADVEYLRYFVAYVIQFQFQRSLCIEAGEYDPNNPKTKPLQECDITSSTKAGNLFKSMLKLGASKSWQDVMEVLTGERKMSSSGILDYFKPLQDWLTTENKKNKNYIGWKKSSKRCLPSGGKV